MTLRERARQDEQMDDPGLEPEIYRQVLLDLERVNTWTLARRATLRFLDRAAKGMPSFRLLDVGYGQGGTLRAIARWAQRRGISVDLVGVDLNPFSQLAAREATPATMAIKYYTGDYVGQLGPFDFIISSLVAHHMSDGELETFITFMEENAKRGWLINDLHRHGFAYRAYPLLARLLRVHRIVLDDGQLSIARAFRPGEWRSMLGALGLPDGGARVVRRFPFRLCVERMR